MSVPSEEEKEMANYWKIDQPFQTLQLRLEKALLQAIYICPSSFLAIVRYTKPHVTSQRTQKNYKNVE